MSDQPLLPIREEPRSVDYFPDVEDEAPWAVKDWRGLKQAFGLEEEDLPAWHKDLAGQGRNWLVIKRIFGVMAHYGDASEEEDMQDWDWKSLARHEGVKEEVLKEDLEAAVDYWKKRVVSNRIGAAAVNPVDSAIRNPSAAMADERITELLEEYRFDAVKGKDRAFVAKRIMEMRSIFEDKHRREAARQIINMELSLGDYERTRSLLKSRLESLSNKSDKSDLSDKDAKEITGIQDSLDKNEKAHTILAEKHRKSIEALGSDEIEQGELRKAALGTAGYFVDSIREYYADGSRALIDGVFTPEELVWLTNPYTIRPAQYRFDLVVAINHALEPFNLFDEEYRPPTIPREASRRMLKLAKGLVEEQEPPHIPEIDDAPTGDEDEDAVEDAPDEETASAIPAIVPPVIEPTREEDLMAM